MSQFSLSLQTDTLEIQATIDADTDLLAAMQSSGLAVRNSCRNSVCGLCKCRLVSGEVTYHWRKPRGLWDEEIAECFILPCIAFAESNLVLNQISLAQNKHPKSSPDS